jgi:hypothetical protein
MMLGVSWYEDKFYLVGLKDSVNKGFSVKGLSEDEINLLKGKGKLMRHLKFRTVNEINKSLIVKLIKIVKIKTKQC